MGLQLLGSRLEFLLVALDLLQLSKYRTLLVVLSQLVSTEPSVADACQRRCRRVSFVVAESARMAEGLGGAAIVIDSVGRVR